MSGVTACAEKRGVARRSLPLHPKQASSSAWIRWGQKVPRAMGEGTGLFPPPGAAGHAPAERATQGSTMVGAAGYIVGAFRECASCHRCLAVRAGAPTLGVCLPAEVRGVSEPDRTLVESSAVTCVEETPVCNLRGGVPDRRGCHRLLESAQTPLHLGGGVAAIGPSASLVLPPPPVFANLPDEPLR